MIRKFLFAALFAATALAGMAAKPKYVFYFIGDGMGLGHVNTTETYLRLTQPNSAPLLMTTFPVRSYATTYSFSSPITDSAAAGTALATGHKTRNGMLGMNPDTLSVHSIAKSFHDRGYAVGITTSVAIDDATPGAFYTHVPSRSHYDNIAQDLGRSGYEFFAGSVLRGKHDPESVVRSHGYNIYHGMDAYNASPRRGKTLILNPEGSTTGHNIGYTIDSIPGALTLPTLTRAAIKHLEAENPKKFFLMVEGGNIDWAGHANDPGTVIREIINFNDALKEAYNFYLRHPKETLIVVTADHDTGGMALGQDGSYVDLTASTLQRSSLDVLTAQLDHRIDSPTPITWEEFLQILQRHTGLGTPAMPLTDKEEAHLRALHQAVFIDKNAQQYETLYNTYNGAAKEVIRILNRRNNIGWTSSYHTGNTVPVYAIGVGAEKFNRRLDNTEIPATITRVAF